MDEKFSRYNIAEMLTEKTGISVSETERFLEELAAIVGEGIRRDRIVKVRGLGVFKIMLVKERESVHVNTGERIVISEHHKLTFIPEKELKELVNKPFSMFSPEEMKHDSPSTDEAPLVTDMRYESDENDENDDELDMPAPHGEDAAREEDTVLLPPPVPQGEAPAAPSQDETALTQGRAEERPGDEETVLLPPPPPPQKENAPSQDETVLLPPPAPKNRPDEQSPAGHATDDETTLITPSRETPPPSRDDAVRMPPPAPGNTQDRRAAEERADEETTFIPPSRETPAARAERRDETVVLSGEKPAGETDVKTKKDEIHKTMPKKKKKSLWPLYAILGLLLLVLGGCVWYLVSDRTVPFFNYNRSAEIRGESFALPGDSVAILIAQEKAREAILPDSTVTGVSGEKPASAPDTKPAVTTATIPSSGAKKDNGSSRSTSSRPVTPAPQPSGTTGSNDVIAKVKMETGKRLTLLALEYYGDKIFWVYIYDFNRSKIGANPNVVPAGMDISIPAKSVYGIDAGNAASVDKARKRQAEIMDGIQ